LAKGKWGRKENLKMREFEDLKGEESFCRRDSVLKSIWFHLLILSHGGLEPA
jgi:hypothetical protein